MNFMSPNIVCRLPIHKCLVKTNISLHSHCPRLISLIYFSESLEEKSLRCLQAGINLLTVLDLEGMATIHTLPQDIGELIHLKYLCLRHTRITEIPSFIDRLANLQTLDLKSVNHFYFYFWELFFNLFIIFYFILLVLYFLGRVLLRIIFILFYSISVIFLGRVLLGLCKWSFIPFISRITFHFVSSSNYK